MSHTAVHVGRRVELDTCWTVQEMVGTLGYSKLTTADLFYSVIRVAVDYNELSSLRRGPAQKLDVHTCCRQVSM